MATAISETGDSLGAAIWRWTACGSGHPQGKSVVVDSGDCRFKAVLGPASGHVRA